MEIRELRTFGECEMKGMIFTGESVRGLLAGRKSMARRAIKPQPILIGNTWTWPCDGMESKASWSVKITQPESMIRLCPYKVGEVIYVKEAWATIKLHNNKAPFAIDRYTNPPLWYKADDPAPSETSCNPWPEGNIGKWRSPLFMPGWFARLFREISGTRVERVQDIDNDWNDCLKEGVMGKNEACCDCNGLHIKVLWRFRELWDSLNAKRGFGWDKNPWVWVYELKEVRKEK